MSKITQAGNKSIYIPPTAENKQILERVEAYMAVTRVGLGQALMDLAKGCFKKSMKSANKKS